MAIEDFDTDEPEFVSAFAPKEPAFPILFEDGEALVINKPGGLPLDTPRAGGDALRNRQAADRHRR